jgi:P27 family predicted phage terminase small subunit
LQDRYAALLAAVARDGLLSVGSKGQTVVHPAARMLSDVERQLSSLEAVLGLTPESRLRLGISAIERESKLDAFIRRHG